MEIFANIIGIAAVAVFVLSYQQKTRNGIVICNVVSRGLYVVQYLLLGAFEGAVLDIVGMLASILAQRKDTPFIRKYLKAIVIGVNLLIVLTGVLLYENLWSLLPIFGVLLHTGAFWLTDEKKIRAMSFLGSPFWFAYNLHSRAFGSSIGDILTMISIAVAIIRYDIKKTDK